MLPDRFDDVTLRTERLVLRPLAEDDAEAMFAVFSHPDVMRYWSSPPWPNIEEARTLIARDLAAMPKGEYLRFGMFTEGGTTFIGMCCLFNFFLPSRRCELGYGMTHEMWGQGYMREALTALLSYGFDTLGFHRIEADTDPRNVASGALLERLGFVREGILRERWIVADEVSDSALYGLLRADWKG